MSPGQAVREALKNSAAVQAIAAARVYPSKLPPNAILPAAVYTLVDSVPQSSFDTPDADALKQARVQIDSYAKDYDLAHELAKAISRYLTELTTGDLVVELATAGRDLFDEELLAHRVVVDFWVWSG